MDKALMDNYTEILRGELIPAMGCTEPIAIAFAAAAAGKLLGEEAEHMVISRSGNMIKNVKAVTVPNSGGQKGIPAAAILGLVGGDPDKKLEVITEVTEEARERTRKLAKEGFCEVKFAENVPNLYISAIVRGKEHSAEIRIENSHTNISLMERDGEVLFQEGEQPKDDTPIPIGDKSLMDLQGILEYADSVDLSEVRELLQRQIDMNYAISQEGLDNVWGACVGKTILEAFGHDVKSCACARAAAGSDARMSGCPLPVVINSGSGNQGITVSMPIVEYAKALEVSEQKRFRALIISNLVSIYIKHFIGALSAFCGAVSASCGAGAGITYLSGGDYPRISKTITNTLANVGGIVCDGAKPSCAAKVASSLHAAILAHHMSMNDKSFAAGEGIVEDDVEETIRNMGYIGKVGMRPTDREILNVMTDQVDVKSCL